MALDIGVDRVIHMKQGDKPAYNTDTQGLAEYASQEADDKTLFLQLLNPLKKNLYNFIRKSMNYCQDCDDVFQDSLLKAFRYFGSYSRDKSFKTWLFTIAHNLIKDHYRKAPRHVSEDIGQLPLIDPNAVPADVSEIYYAASQLKPRQREVFFLYYYNEFRVGEIVDITGLTKYNVKYILHQARSALKKIMEVEK